MNLHFLYRKDAKRAHAFRLTPQTNVEASKLDRIHYQLLKEKSSHKYINNELENYIELPILPEGYIT